VGHKVLEAAGILESRLHFHRVGGEVAEDEHRRLMQPFSRVPTKNGEMRDAARVHDHRTQLSRP